MIRFLTDIPEEVRRSAAEIIQGQASVPESPLRRTSEGKVELCAAAALAVAASHAGHRDVLIERLEREGRDYIMDAFEAAGWSRSLGRQVLVANDSIAAVSRKDEILKLLQAN